MFVFNSGDLDLAAEELNITGIKMIFDSKWSDFLNLDDIGTCSVIKELLKRDDAFELIKSLLTRWKLDLSSSYVIGPMNFIRECYTIEESISDVIMFISNGKNEDFSMIGFIRDLFQMSLVVLDRYIVIEAIKGNNVSLLEYMEKDSTYDFHKPTFLNFPDCGNYYYWNENFMYKKAMVFLLERIKEINDSELIALIQYSVFNDRDTDVFKN